MDSLHSLESSLDDLEAVLAPLLGTALSETVTQLDLLHKAKLQVLLPYVVNDLVFIYLKTRGINPKTHPVIGELDRVKQYFDKIKNAEEPETRSLVVDKDAATRFIKHAIKASQAAQEKSRREMKQGTHTRFTDATVTVPSPTLAAQAKIQARENAGQGEADENGEGDLEVFDMSAEGMVTTRTVKNEKGKGKGKGKEKERTELPVGKKRRRGMDPWAGYDETNGNPHLATDALPGEPRCKLAKDDHGEVGVARITVESQMANKEKNMNDNTMEVEEKVTGTPVHGKKKKKKKKKKVDSSD